ncbi:hypothetical protein CFIO01_11718 [Colletotrichum fioriniae PJ7]|uniref:Uncharacterized protein n=1 Tax=Colletotrichum fioriniae PJ7 TaxID=1445577 RepID=A0A010QP20_9PEZI|nr:hypothetical protein CFIO01_11718 [Colletotrichum fioriniae PJ7]
MPASNNPAATNHQLCILPSTAKRTTTGQRGAAGYLRALRRHLRIMEFANAGGGCHRRARDAAPQSPTTAITRRLTGAAWITESGRSPRKHTLLCVAVAVSPSAQGDTLRCHFGSVTAHLPNHLKNWVINGPVPSNERAISLQFGSRLCDSPASVVWQPPHCTLADS